MPCQGWVGTRSGWAGHADARRPGTWCDLMARLNASWPQEPPATHPWSPVDHKHLVSLNPGSLAMPETGLNQNLGPCERPFPGCRQQACLTYTLGQLSRRWGGPFGGPVLTLERQRSLSVAKKDGLGEGA